MATGSGFLPCDSRGLRHLSEHERLSVDGTTSGTAAAVFENVQCGEQRIESFHAGERLRRAVNRRVEHVCRRTEFPRRLRAELASVAAARPADVSHRDRHLPGNEGQPSDAGVRAQHVSAWRRESVRVVSGRLRLPRVERPFHSQCGTGAVAAPAPKRSDRHRAVHICKSKRRCGGVWRSGCERSGRRAGLAEP